MVGYVNIYTKSTTYAYHPWIRVFKGISPLTFNFPASVYDLPYTHDWIFNYWIEDEGGVDVPGWYTYGDHGDGSFRELADDQVFQIGQEVTLTAGRTDVHYHFLPYNKRIASYTITYLANGGTGTMTPSVVNYGDSFTFKNNDFTKTGHDFKEWRLNAANGNYISVYSSGYIYGNWYIQSNCTATAEWNIQKYSIAYDANGGSGTMTPSTATYGSNFTFQYNGFTKSGFNFAGWWLYIGNERVNDTATYSDQSTFFWDIDNTQRTITAKAQWEEIPPEEIRVTYLRDPPDVLYGFFKHTFSTCGAVGRKGPTLSQVKTAYSTVSWAQNTAYLSMVTPGIQEWKVPATGSYTIECKGARGAGGSHGTNPRYTYPPGKGAKISATFNLTKDEVIGIVVGQEGVAGHPLNTEGGYGGLGGGGGGGSFVYRKTYNLICIIAGGGGSDGRDRGYGGHGSANYRPVNGFNNLWLDGGLGNGNRGWQDGLYGGRGGGPANDPVQADWNDAAGGGGGWWSNGEDGLRAINHSGYTGGYGGRGSHMAITNSGTPFVGGFHARDNSDGGQGNGGFGGGGGSGGQTAGGGGGGATGGGGGNSYGFVAYTGYSVTGTCGGGQGAGSYNNGIDGTQTNVEGNNDGPGSVIITNKTISGDYYNNTLTYSISSPTITYTFLDNNFTKTGYDFIGWHLYDGNTRINPNSIYNVGELFTFTLEKNIYYAVAQWVLKTSSIKYEANGGAGTLATNPQTATYSLSFTFQTSNGFTKKGYKFKSWDLYDEVGTFIALYSSGASYGNWNKTGKKYTAKAQWIAESYTITYSENGGTGNVESNIVSYDSPFTFQNNGFTRIGYTFSGWHLYDGNNNRINTETYGPTTESYLYGTWNIDKNVTAKAQWTAKEYTITYSANEGTGTTYSNKATYDSPYTFSNNTFTRTGYEFSGWHLYDVNNNRINTKIYGPTTESYSYGKWDIDKNITAQAQWTRSEFIVTFDANGKGGANGTGGTIIRKQNYNTIVTCPTINAIGYVFGGWATSFANAESKIVDKAGNATFTLGAADENYYAIWTLNKNGIRFSELQSVFDGSHPISISEYRTQSGQTIANSEIRLGIHLKGKSRLS